MRATRRPSGPLPFPRVAINQPGFYDAVRGSRISLDRIKRIVGATDRVLISRLIGADSVPATELNISRLERIATIVGFDRSQLFLGEAAHR